MVDSQLRRRRSPKGAARRFTARNAGVTMKEIAWWQRAVIYQVYPRSFQDSDGDGVGDLNGISRRLEHLARLEIDAVWISPIFPSPMADFGYDVRDYCAIDPLFGSLADFDALLSPRTRAASRSSLISCRTTPPVNIPGFRTAAPRGSIESGTGMSGETRSLTVPRRTTGRASLAVRLGHSTKWPANTTTTRT